MKIDLSSIRNTVKNDINNNVKNDATETKKITTKQKDVNNNVLPDWTKLTQDFNNTTRNEVAKIEVVKNDVVKNEVINNTDKKTLTENERMKIISILNLYICEFPEKLGKYKNKQLHTMSDDNLIALRDDFHREVSTTNQLSMVVDASKKALQVYEYLMCSMDVDLEGVSRVGNNPEWDQNIKAVCLKHMDNITFQTEPEYKLLFLLVSGSIMTHQINTMNKTNNKLNNIENNEEAIKQPITEPQNNINDEQVEIMKRLELNSLQNKYNDI